MASLDYRGSRRLSRGMPGPKAEGLGLSVRPELVAESAAKLKK
jgi:hypothetical protein